MEDLNALLPCPLCQLPHFENVDSLRSTLIAAATTPLNCPICKESVLGLDKLTIHLFVHINDNVKNIENNSFVEKSKKGDEIIINNSDLVKANALSTNFETNTIVCDICDFKFTDKTILELHQKLLHQTPPDKETGIYNFHCHLCTKKFKMKGSLIVHLRVAHYGFSEIHSEQKRMKLLNDGSDTSPRKSGDSKQWECDICCKMFTTKYFLKKHKRLHTGEMPYTCLQCKKSFTFQQSFHKHMLYHSSEKPHSCDECGRSFKELSTLQNHIRIHSGERPFSCESCGKSFRQRVSYLVHRRIHTGVMPYGCDKCGKKFRYKVSQRSHKCVFKSASENDTTVQSILPFGSELKAVQADDMNQMLGKKDFFGSSVLDRNDLQCSINYSMLNDPSTGLNNEESGHQHDLYTMMLSPLLSDVETLCQALQK